MSTSNHLPVIDADAHVIETARTWDYLEPSEQKYRPLLYSSPDNATSQYWMMDGKICGRRFPTLSEGELKTLSEKTGRNMETPLVARELDDVNLRLKHMDELGIDIQVLHNTFWIEQGSPRPEVEAAICRAWNRWLADVWRKGGGRLRWSCVVPSVLIDEAVSQVKIAKENGAVAVCLKPLEGDRHITDPYFYPLYEAASNLDMAMAVHIANGNPDYCDLYRHTPGSTMLMFRMPTVAACFILLMGEVPRVFPKLRWGFIETSAQWVPWIYHEAAIRYKGAGREFPEDIFHEYKIFVTCQTNDDIAYILRYAGQHSLAIGTDYGHTDTSVKLDAITEFKGMEGISQEDRERILSHNPRALYAL